MRMNVRCPVCGNLYDLAKLQILGERDQQILAYIDCINCTTALISILSVNPTGMTAQGLVTDLSAEEIVSLEDRKPLGHNDVLEIHQRLDDSRSPFFTHRY